MVRKSARTSPPPKRVAPGRPNAFDPVYRWVKKIPAGRVMTYGQIAELLGYRLSARAVGWAMHACPGGVPWHRVVNASGACSSDRVAREPGRQRRLLEREGVRFKGDGCLDLEKHRWVPRRRVRFPGARSRTPR